MLTQKPSRHIEQPNVTTQIASRHIGSYYLATRVLPYYSSLVSPLNPKTYSFPHQKTSDKSEDFKLCLSVLT